jgi:hypothetical protein
MALHVLAPWGHPQRHDKEMKLALHIQVLRYRKHSISIKRVNLLLIFKKTIVVY